MVFSGIVGIALADTAFFAALNRLGVGIISIVDCLYSPFVVFCAWILIGEELTIPHYVGGALILSSVLLSSKHPPPPGRTNRQIVAGVLLGAMAMALMAFGIVLTKPVLEGEDFPLLWAATIRLTAGTVFLPVLIAASPRRSEYMRAFKPSRTWLLSIPASILGSYLAYIFWIGGFKYGQASVVCLLNQTSVVFALILATLILKEPFTRRKLIAVVLAVIGSVIILLLANNGSGTA
jgi:drug/metabolite transporter (DMT)-like permease